MGRKLGVTPSFGKPRSTGNIVVSGAGEVHLQERMGLENHHETALGRDQAFGQQKSPG
jgi:hypothetical protein